MRKFFNTLSKHLPVTLLDLIRCQPPRLSLEDKTKNRKPLLSAPILTIAAYLVGMGLIWYGWGGMVYLALYESGDEQIIHLEWITEGKTFRIYTRSVDALNETHWNSEILTLTGQRLKTEIGNQPPDQMVQFITGENGIVVDTNGRDVYLSEANRRREKIYDGLSPGGGRARRAIILLPVGFLLMVASPLAILPNLIKSRRAGWAAIMLLMILVTVSIGVWPFIGN